MALRRRREEGFNVAEAALPRKCHGRRDFADNPLHTLQCSRGSVASEIAVSADSPVALRVLQCSRGSVASEISRPPARAACEPSARFNVAEAALPRKSHRGKRGQNNRENRFNVAEAALPRKSLSSGGRRRSATALQCSRGSVASEIASLKLAVRTELFLYIARSKPSLIVKVEIISMKLEILSAMSRQFKRKSYCEP